MSNGCEELKAELQELAERWEDCGNPAEFPIREIRQRCADDLREVLQRYE